VINKLNFKNLFIIFLGGFLVSFSFAQQVRISPEDAIKELQKKIDLQQSLIESQQKQINQLVEILDGKRVPASPKTSAVNDNFNPTASNKQSPVPEKSTPSSSVLVTTSSENSVNDVNAPALESHSQGIMATSTSIQPTVGTNYEGIKVTLGGAIRMNYLATSYRGQPDGTTFFLLPNIPSVNQGSGTLDPRSSRIFLDIDGKKFGDYKMSGLLMFVFSNGDYFSGQTGFNPLIAYADIKNETERYAIGIQEDVFSPRFPGTLDSIAALAGAGNPGNTFRPQVRAERYLKFGDANTLAIEAALSSPLPSSININNKNINGYNQQSLYILENTGIPDAEFRLGWTQGAKGNDWIPFAPLEIGFSGLYGRFRTVDTSSSLNPSYNSNTWGLGVDMRFKLTKQIGFQAEVYTGKAMGPFLGGIFQTTNASTQQTIPSTGAWAEGIMYWSPSLHSHLGYGQDRADTSYVPVGGFTKNQGAFLNLIWDYSKYTMFGIEGSWKRTDYQGIDGNQGYGVMLVNQLNF